MMRVLLEGRPGAGKSTVARRVADTLRDEGIPVNGFVTEEIRQSGRRLGFSVERLDGERAVLAHVELPGPPRVGRYGVDLTALERVAIPAMNEASEGEVAIVDELGKMELASSLFREAFSELLEGPVPVVATVQSAPHPFTDALKRRRDIETLQVTTANRNELPDLLAALLGSGVPATGIRTRAARMTGRLTKRFPDI
jgi:nucleoside-triphosphatase